MEDVIIKEVVTSKQLHDFIYLPEKVHKDEPNWLPPIYMDERLLFNKKKNKSYKYADAILLLAYKGNTSVGRIMALVNNRYNEIHKENHGRFCFMECYNDKEVFHALIASAEDWARKKGMSMIVGPLGFSDKDPQGFQIEGFEYPQLITIANNSPYMVDLIVGEGYEKKIDLIDYLIKMPDELPLIYQKVLSRVEKTESYRLIEFTKKKELKPYIIPVLELMNDTFMEIYGFVPLNDKEKVEFANRYLPILDPKFIKVAEADNKLIGFAISMPDMSKGIKACNGRLLPFGIFKVLQESKRSKKLMMMLGGVRKEYRGKGIDVLMGVKILESAIKHRMEVIDSHLVLENNSRMRAEYERVGGKIAKKFRIYQKAL
ncbi:MAG: GNAT family N-acetyltransferase [Bacteroidales bacterium]|jgi:GNAT superfamily N-acetyltransferase|nr:GNAT family N-acetyltransferase [Bacteroidales bacterium]